MVEINPLATVFESKTVKPLNTVCSYPTNWSYIFLRSPGHFLKEMQKCISLLLALERLVV